MESICNKYVKKRDLCIFDRLIRSSAWAKKESTNSEKYHICMSTNLLFNWLFTSKEVTKLKKIIFTWRRLSDSNTQL